MDNTIPEITIGRLPIYLQALEHMESKGMKTTSSQELGDSIGISAAQIRKDLSQFGEFGKQGKGYSISYLVEQLKMILHVNRLWDMVVIGAGHLGTAIANYPHFHQHGFRVVAIFDNDPHLIGKQVGQLIVCSTEDMESIIRDNSIRIAMLTVPASAAQSVTDHLIGAGIRSILNYAPIVLSVPQTVHVQYIDPIIYLQRMTYYLD